MVTDDATAAAADTVVWAALFDDSAVSRLTLQRVAAG
jgi:hypothetical protein